MSTLLAQANLSGPTGSAPEELQKFSINPFKYVEECYQMYGDIVRLPFCVDGDLAPSVAISNPDAIQVLNSPATLKYLENKFTIAPKFLLGGEQHLASVDKSSHQRLKKLMLPLFNRQALEAQTQPIWEIAKRHSSFCQGGESFWVVKAMKALTLDVIVQIIFGVTEGSKHDTLKQRITEWIRWGASPEVSQAFFLESLRDEQDPDSPWNKHLQNLKGIDEILYAEISARRAEPDINGKDILSMLLAAKDEEGHQISDIEVRDNLMLMFFAGHDNTSSASSWLFYELHNHPDCLEQLQQELAPFEDAPDPLAISQLPYLSAACKEVLRLYGGSALSLPRVLNAPLTLAGYQLEAGTCISSSYHLVHRRPELYPEAEQFNPQRFLDRDYASHQWLAFGGGHRHCVGAALAQLEMKLSLAAFLLRYRLERLEHAPIALTMENLVNALERDFQMRVVASR